MQAAQTHQQQLLDQIRFVNRATPISERTESAYLQTARHMFVSRYRRLGRREWSDVTADNFLEHLPAIYADAPLILAGNDDGDIASTISQPSLVLRMLDMLRVKPGQKILEIGAGSGWSAALLGQLVGPSGHVYSVEIIPDLATRAASAIQALGIQNVRIIEADGGLGYAAAAPYDRVIFTAGTYDLPRYFYEQVKEGGLLLGVIKTEGGGDCLFLLRKTEDHFESIESMHVAFVQMTGKYRDNRLEPLCLERSSEWPSLQSKEVARFPFWWGGKGKESFVWRTWGIRSFLGITEPLFQAFKTEKIAGSPYDEHFFGLWDRPAESLVIARDDVLLCYGTITAKERLMRDLETWLCLGMPTTASFSLQVFRDDASQPFRSQSVGR